MREATPAVSLQVANNRLFGAGDPGVATAERGNPQAPLAAWAGSRP